MEWEHQAGGGYEHWPFRPFGGDEHQWQQAQQDTDRRYTKVEDTARAAGIVDRTDIKEDLARLGQVVEHTDYGWIRWDRTTDRCMAVTAMPAEVGAFAPRWRRGWRGVLMRRLWSHAPILLVDLPWAVPLVPVLVGLGVVLAGVAGLGPMLRGSTAVTVPLSLAVLVAAGVPYVLRKLTRSKVLVVTGRGWAAKQLHHVLGARQSIAEAASRTGPAAEEVERLAELGDWLVWEAAELATAGKDWRMLQATVRSAGRLADLTDHNLAEPPYLRSARSEDARWRDSAAERSKPLLEDLALALAAASGCAHRSR